MPELAVESRKQAELHFFAYGMAWDGLKTIAVRDDRVSSHVQGVGDRPYKKERSVKDNTADFGVGAFLLASSEIIKDQPIILHFLLVRMLQFYRELRKL